MKRIFTQSVSMLCTQEQYEKDLKEELKELGYKSVNSPLTDNFPILFANHRDARLFIFSRCTLASEFIDHYNPQLFLALAAMSEGDGIWWGEYIINLPDGRVDSVIGGGTDRTPIESKRFGNARKATVEEIINHFKREKLKELLNNTNYMNFNQARVFLEEGLCDVLINSKEKSKTTFSMTMDSGEKVSGFTNEDGKGIVIESFINPYTYNTLPTRQTHETKRVKKLLKAIRRKVNSNESIPEEWQDELNQLLDSRVERRIEA